MSSEASDETQSLTATTRMADSQPSREGSRQQEEEDQAGERTPSGATLFTVLKNDRRRHVLRFLLEEQRRVSLAELAVHIAGKENDIEPSAVTSAQRKRVYVSLYQSHLPTLHDSGAVDYNEPRKYAHPAEGIEVFRPYLEETTDAGSWSMVYLAIGAVGAASSMFLAANLIPSSLSSSVPLALMTVLFIISLVHFYSQREE